MLTVPAGIQRYGVHWEVCVRDLLTGVLTAAAILVDHRCPVAVDDHAHLHKPVLSANLAEVTGNRIHHPKALALFCQVLGAVCQQVSAADAVVLLSASEVAELRGVEFFHGCVLL